MGWCQAQAIKERTTSGKQGRRRGGTGPSPKQAWKWSPSWKREQVQERAELIWDTFFNIQWGTACDLIAFSTSWGLTSFQQQEMCHAHQVWSTKPTEAGRNAPMDISGLGVRCVCSGRHLDQWTVQLWTLVSSLTRLLTCRMCFPFDVISHADLFITAVNDSSLKSEPIVESWKALASKLPPRTVPIPLHCEPF